MGANFFGNDFPGWLAARRVQTGQVYNILINYKNIANLAVRRCRSYGAKRDDYWLGSTNMSRLRRWCRIFASRYIQAFYSPSKGSSLLSVEYRRRRDGSQ
jgi:hypothetical protein